MREPTTITQPPPRRGLGPIRIAVVVGATLILLGSAAATFAHGGFGLGGGGGDRGGSIAGPITITAISGSNLSLKTDDGWTRTIAVTSSTAITKGNDTIAVTDLKVGDAIRLGQTKNDDGSYTVTAIHVVLPHVAGTVTAKSGSTITVLETDGTSSTVHTSSATTYRVPGVTDADLGDITVGMIVVASGTERSDGSLDAATVGAGFGGRRFHGRGGWDLIPDTSPAPSATTSTS
ncbi:MAG TPA: DUF5666 domain-containing protein [Candidatus Limnocylindrales bacterium]|nr:DUF5666 domain-containing protein [Candidatus Limnocylindrales bacterium]